MASSETLRGLRRRAFGIAFGQLLVAIMEYVWNRGQNARWHNKIASNQFKNLQLVDG